MIPKTALEPRKFSPGDKVAFTGLMPILNVAGTHGEVVKFKWTPGGWNYDVRLDDKHSFLDVPQEYLEPHP